MGSELKWNSISIAESEFILTSISGSSNVFFIMSIPFNISVSEGLD